MRDAGLAATVYDQGVGRAGDLGWASDRILVALGHHRDGFVLGPATGELIRDLILDQRPRFDATAFVAPAR